MNYYKPLLVLALLIGLLSSLTLSASAKTMSGHIDKKIPSPTSAKSEQRQLNVTSFSRLNISGNIEVMLKPNSPKRHVLVVENPEFLAHRQVGSELMLNSLSYQDKQRQTLSPQVKLVIAGYPIAHIMTSGNAMLIAKNWRDHAPLSIIATGNSSVNLAGVVQLAQVNLADSARIHARWVDSSNLIINAQGNSGIQLAGTAKRVFVRLNGNSMLDGRFLRVSDLHIKTTAQAAAEVTPLQKFAGFAYDSSRILYYKTPGHLLDISAQSGNVLQMAHWN